MAAWSDFKADCANYPAAQRLFELPLWSIAFYRLAQGVRDTCPDIIPVKVLVASINLLARILTGNDIPTTAEIGPGLTIYHGGNIVLNPHTKMGSNCKLRHGVTIGNRHSELDVPVIGDRVEMGAYAQVLGDIRIGDDARIGAMSVVLIDVPDGATAVGIPARVIPRGE